LYEVVSRTQMTALCLDTIGSWVSV